MSSKIRLRPALMEDFQAVMDIDTDVYGGLDYLGSYYAWTVQAPECLAFVGIIDGKVVFYAFHVVVPGGHSMYSGGGRMMKKHRGGSLMPLRKHITKIVRQKYPNVVEHHQMNLSSSAREQRLKKHASGPYFLKIEEKWGVEISLFTLDDLKRSTTHESLSASPQPVRRITPKEMQTIMPQIIHILSDGRDYFTHGCLWLPAEINDSTIRYAARHCTVAGTFTGAVNDQITSLSFSAFTTVRIGCCGVFQWYGTSSEQCIEHVKYFLQLYRKLIDESYPGKLSSIIHVCGQVDFEAVRQFICSQLGDSFNVPHHKTSNGGDAMLEIEKF